LETPRQLGPWTLAASTATVMGFVWPPTASPSACERRAPSPAAGCTVPPTPSPSAFHYCHRAALVNCHRGPAATELRLTGLV
jgi:hypothetical protein